MKRLITTLLVIAVIFSAIGLVAAQTDAPTEEPTAEVEPEATTESSDTSGRPYLGVRFGPNDDGDGVVIVEVVVDSPADEAGLQAGDIVTAVNGEEFGAGNLAALVGSFAPGDTVTLTIERDGETQDIDVTLGTAPDSYWNQGQGRRQDRRQDRRDRRGNNFGDMDDFDFEYEFSDRPFLGISLSDEDDRAVVMEVVADSPAEAAGIEAGDVITAINGEEVADSQAVVDAIAELEAGDEVTVTIERDGETQELTATLAEGSFELFFPELPGMEGLEGLEGFPGGRIFMFPGMRGVPGMGLHMAPMILGVDGAVLDETTAQEFNVPQQDGFYISRVLTGSAAAEAGLLAGDVITSINGTPVTDDLDMQDLMETIMGSDSLSVEVLRDGETLTFDVQLPDVMMPGFQDRLPSPDEPAEPTEELEASAA